MRKLLLPLSVCSLCLLVMGWMTAFPNTFTRVSLPLRTSGNTPIQRQECGINLQALRQQESISLKAYAIPQHQYPLEIQVTGGQLREHQITNPQETITVTIIRETTQELSKLVIRGTSCMQEVPIEQPPSISWEEVLTSIETASAPISREVFLAHMYPLLEERSTQLLPSREDPCRNKPVALREEGQSRATHVSAMNKSIKSTQHPIHITFCDQSLLTLDPQSSILLYGTTEGHRAYIREGGITYTTAAESIPSRSLLRTPDMDVYHTRGTLSLTYNHQEGRTRAHQIQGMGIIQRFADDTPSLIHGNPLQSFTLQGYQEEAALALSTLLHSQILSEDWGTQQPSSAPIRTWEAAHILYHTFHGGYTAAAPEVIVEFMLRRQFFTAAQLEETQRYQPLTQSELSHLLQQIEILTRK